jgi:hypothetical protein
MIAVEILTACCVAPQTCALLNVATLVYGAALLVYGAMLRTSMRERFGIQGAHCRAQSTGTFTLFYPDQMLRLPDLHAWSSCWTCADVVQPQHVLAVMKWAYNFSARVPQHCCKDATDGASDYKRPFTLYSGYAQARVAAIYSHGCAAHRAACARCGRMLAS